MGKWLLCI